MTSFSLQTSATVSSLVSELQAVTGEWSQLQVVSSWIVAYLFMIVVNLNARWFFRYTFYMVVLICLFLVVYSAWGLVFLNEAQWQWLSGGASISGEASLSLSGVAQSFPYALWWY